MDTRQLREHFNRHAQDFDRLYSVERQSVLQRWLNRRFHSDITTRYLAALDHVRGSGAKSVLDVGCGPGHYLTAMAQLGIPRIVGIDVSERMLEIASKRPEISEHAGIELINADYARWESDEQFDVILAIGFFDYVADPVPVLRRMRAHARSSVFASFPSRHWFRTPFRRIRRGLQGTQVYFYDETRISEFAAAAGFRNVEISRLPGAGMNFVAVFGIS